MDVRAIVYSTLCIAHVPIALAYSKIYMFLFNDSCFHCTRFKSYRTITQVFAYALYGTRACA